MARVKGACAIALALSLLPHPVMAAPNIKPVIESYSVSPAIAFANQAVTFAVVATDADGTIVSYEWNFPDVGGWVAGTSSMMKVFTTEGTYHVGVRVQDDRNGSTSQSHKVTITAEPPPPPPPPSSPPSPSIGSVPMVMTDTGRVTIRVSVLTGNIEIL